MFLKLLLVLSNTLISAVLIIAAPHASRSMISSLSLAVLHNSMNYLIIDFVYHTSPQPPRLWLEATAVSESVTFTWIQDSESWPGVPVETIRFTCCEGPHFSGKRLPSKIFPNLDGDHKMLVFRFRLPEPPLDFTKFFVQMLVKNSAHRLPLHKVLEHPWIVQNADPSGVYRG